MGVPPFCRSRASNDALLRATQAVIPECIESLYRKRQKPPRNVPLPQKADGFLSFRCSRPPSDLNSDHKLVQT